MEVEAEEEKKEGKMGPAAVDHEAEVTVMTNSPPPEPSQPPSASSQQPSPSTNTAPSLRSEKEDEITVEEAGNGEKKSPTAPLVFDPDSELYMANACCELLHYKYCPYVVGVLELFMIAGWIVINYYWYARVGINLAGGITIGVQAFIAVVAVVCIGLMFFAMAKEKPMLLWPHMVFQMLGIAAGIILTIVAVVAMAAGTTVSEAVFGAIFGHANLPNVEKALGPIWPFCLAVIFDFGAAIGIWFYILVRGAYDFLLDKAFFADYSRRKRKPAGEEEAVDGEKETAT